MKVPDSSPAGAARLAIYSGMKELAEDYEMTKPGGAFYLFPRAPWGTGTEFVSRAIEEQLLIIPGSIFSQRDTHFRISYAADWNTLRRGAEVLKKLAQPA